MTGYEKLTTSCALIETLPEQLKAQARMGRKKEIAEQVARVKILAQEARRRGLDKDPQYAPRINFQMENMLAGALFSEIQAKTIVVARPREEWVPYAEGLIPPIINMSGMKNCGLWFPNRQLGLANGVLAMGMALGFLIGTFLSATVLSPWLGGWRNVMFFFGGIAVLLSIPWLFSPEPPVSADAATAAVAPDRPGRGRDEGARLPVLAAAGHPGFQIVFAIGRSAQIARGGIDDAVRQFQSVADLTFDGQYLLMHGFTVIGFAEDEHLQFGELVHPVEAL